MLDRNPAVLREELDSARLNGEGLWDGEEERERPGPLWEEFSVPGCRKGDVWAFRPPLRLEAPIDSACLKGVGLSARGPARASTSMLRSKGSGGYCGG